MTGQELRQWRLVQGWTRDEAARYLGTTKTTVYRWEVGIHHVPKTIDILTWLLTIPYNYAAVALFLEGYP